MHWVSAVSQKESLLDALDEVSQALHAGMKGDPVDLLLVFPSQHHLFDYGRILPRLRENLGPARTVGVSANCVIGSHLELEHQPGVSVIAAHLPAVDMAIRRVTRSELPPLDGSPQPWRDLIGVDAELKPDFIVLADPYSLEVQQLLTGIDYAYPESTIVGGLASGAQGPRGNGLFLDQEIHRSGALVIALWGNVKIDAVVSQGCRPIGKPVRVTECDGHLLTRVDEQSPTEYLSSLYNSLDEDTRALVRSSLHLGIVVDELREEIGPGDFVIRNILGMHQESGVVAIGSDLRAGQTVQFHVRDGKSAIRDLDAKLEAYKQKHPADQVAGALQFSCLGRGQGFLGVPNHDVGMLQESLGPLPVCGFFGSGEIGPIATSTYLHGFTTVMGLVHPRSG
jgi:small ligand-binding sensory domain FIST